jgi:PHD/YefM family antitoxin component YafN of YafNO toxin-antitoxin module
VLLLRRGRPAAVIVDVESWEEAGLAATQSA